MSPSRTQIFTGSSPKTRLARGSASLADAELLALLLRTGVAGQDVLQLAQALLDRFGGLAGLMHADVNALKSIKGLGPAKRAEIAAVIEIARRSLGQRMTEAPVFDHPQRVKDYLALHLAPLEQEAFAVMLLDAHHRLIAFEILFRGTLNQTSVYPREVVRLAMARKNERSCDTNTIVPS